MMTTNDPPPPDPCPLGDDEGDTVPGRYSIADIAALHGVTQRTVCDWIRGRKRRANLYAPLTCTAAGRLLGVSGKTISRWVDEGRLSYPLTMEQVEAKRVLLQVRPRGPRRNPQSARYTIGRHSYSKHRA